MLSAIVADATFRNQSTVLRLLPAHNLPSPACSLHPPPRFGTGNVVSFASVHLVTESWRFTGTPQRPPKHRIPSIHPFAFPKLPRGSCFQYRDWLFLTASHLLVDIFQRNEGASGQYCFSFSEKLRQGYPFFASRRDTVIIYSSTGRSRTYATSCPQWISKSVVQLEAGFIEIEVFQ